MEFGEVRILRVSGEMFRELSWWGFGERSEPRAILGGQQLALAEVSLKLIYRGRGRRPRSHPESRNRNLFHLIIIQNAFLLCKPTWTGSARLHTFSPHSKLIPSS